MNRKSQSLEKICIFQNVAYSTFLDYEFKGNIGELKNTIKATCAKGLLNQSSDTLRRFIRWIFHPIFLKQSNQLQLKTHSRDNETLFSIHDLKGELKPVIPLLQFYARLLNAFEGEEDFSKVVDPAEVLIQNFIDYLFFRTKIHVGDNRTKYIY